MKIYSKYKLLGGFGFVLLLNIASACLFAFVFTLVLKKDSIYFWKDEGARSGIILVSFIEGVLVAVLITQCKRIEIDAHSISFRNVLFPRSGNTFKWTDYDYYMTVMEYSQGKDWEAIWLIKNQRIKSRISSFYYSNYLELKQGIRIQKGELNIGAFDQLMCIFGKKIKNIT